jgi:raffinose/stachyose/melibiose transport system substrate-binding protein
VNLVSKRFLGGIAIIALASAACSSTSATPGATATPAPSGEPTATPTKAPVTIEWWHIGTTDPGKSMNQGFADAFVAANPHVTINITILENEAFKTKLATTIQSGTVPDLFQSWGGGTLAEQAKAGMLKDITADVADIKDLVSGLSGWSYDGKTYGVPFDLGMIGFWYNKALFAKAGITAVPTTWTEYLADVQKLKDAGIVPLAIAGKDKWPSMHLWTYLVLRIGGGDVLAKMVASGDWNTDACVNAGKEVLKLNALNPYQPGYKTATYDNEAAAVGNAKAAMELMGQWAPTVQMADSTSKLGIGDDLGWFPFPVVEGGAGAAGDGVGGGNGFAVGKDAPAEAVEFLKFMAQPDQAKQINENATGLSPTAGLTDSIKDPNLKMVAEGLAKAKFMQLYLDQVTTPAVGSAINDATVALFLGASTPEKVCQAITTVASS